MEGVSSKQFGFRKDRNTMQTIRNVIRLANEANLTVEVNMDVLLALDFINALYSAS